jgi:predicted nucleic acid-binding protein
VDSGSAKGAPRSEEDPTTQSSLMLGDFGITFDTGILIALERREERARKILQRVTETKTRVTVPVATLAEWWRARTDLRDAILAATYLEPLTPECAKLAGLALSVVRGATVGDAIVMASAASRGDIVYTTDFGDLSRLSAYFPNVRVLSL